MSATKADHRGSRRLLYVANVSWFFVSHRLPHAELARAAGYDVHVATRVTTSVDAQLIREAGLTLHNVPMGRGDSGVVYDLKSLLVLLRLIKRLQPDIVHLVGMKPLVFGGLAARILGVPSLVVAIPGLGTVFSSAGVVARVRRALVVAMMRMSLRRRGTRLIFQNQRDLEILVKLNLALREHSRLIRGSGVRLSDFSIDREPGEPLRIVLAARMLRTKGVIIFAEAARLLKKDFPDAQFLLAGDVDTSNPDSLTRDELHSMISAGNLYWLGHVKDMSALLRSCHIVCLPTYYGEGVPKALIEGAAAARPLVTTSIPGCDDICLDGVNGLLVPPRSVQALIDALARLMRNAELRKEFGMAGRRRAETFFSLDLIARQILEVYEEFDTQCSRHA